MKHEKLSELVHSDFFDFSAIEEQLYGYNACFFCLGVSSIGMKENDYRRITYDLTMQLAHTLSRLNSEMTFCYVSGAGTDGSEKGRLMWARVKGKTENDLAKLPFKAVYLFRPGFIKPTKGLHNAFTIAKIAGLLYPILKPLLPKYMCTLEEVGLAMIHAAQKGYAKQILENEHISEFARGNELN